MKIIESLSKLGFAEHKTYGSSMMPFIRSGDRAIIVKKMRRLSKGEIALFLQGDKLLLHRVKKVKTNGYVFCGDNRYKKDGFIPEDAVFGRLVAIYKKDKKVECEQKAFRVKSAIFNFFLFKPFLIFFMRAFSRIKKLFKRK